MTSEWATYQLSEVVSLMTGKLDSNAATESGAYPFFTCSPTTLSINNYAFDTEAILLAGNNANGIFPIKYFKGKFNAYQRTYVIEPLNTKEVSCKFLYYAISDLIGRLQELSIGSATKFLTKTILNNLQVKLPRIEEQMRIEALLSSIDDRITLLRETNKTLEAIAQAIFKSWFVDFDPVRAKMAGRQPESMDEATAALFPDSFEESELGLVPKGWRGQQLDQIAEYLNGLALQKYPPTGINDLPVIKIAQLRKGDTLGSDKASREIKSEYIIQDGDVLFSWSGSLEVEVWCGGEGALNQHLFKVTSRTFPKWLYLYATKLFLGEFRKIAESKATTMGHIQRRHLSDAKLALPDNVLISKLSEVFEPLLDRYISNSLQARTLVSIRDTLLPRLISGQLRLPEAQEQIENA